MPESPLMGERKAAPSVDFSGVRLMDVPSALLFIGDIISFFLSEVAILL